MKAVPHISLDSEGGRRAAFELGRFFSECGDNIRPDGIMYVRVRVSPEALIFVRKFARLHDACCDAAEAAIKCWLTEAWKLGVVKDIRELIADSLWEQRWAWMQQEPAK